jgi:UDP-2,3-diacylglucosamine hydrolase
MTTYFISDLHLTPRRTAVTQLFYDFLDMAALDAEAIYILGDLFEFWVGDDAVDVVGQTGVFSAIRRVTEQETPVFFMPGNRDFLAGSEFESSTGCRILTDPSRIELDGARVLLMHGDSMCIDDTAHQHFRTLVNDTAWRREFLDLPVEKRIELALNARSQSALHTSMTSMDIMDVNQDAVQSEIAKHDVQCLIHGHTHRPGIHPVTVDGRRSTRIVLGDWNAQNSVLRYESGIFQLSARGLDFPPVHLITNTEES